MAVLRFGPIRARGHPIERMRPLARTVLTALVAAFTLAVAAPPAFADAPVGVDDAYSTPEDQTLNVPVESGVLVNDTDTESAALTAQLVDVVSGGTLALDPSGSFIYTPAQDANGDVTFTYQPFDGPDGGNVTTVTITVTSQNDPPVANDDGPLTTDEDTPLVIDVPADVLANDEDVDGDTLSILAVANPVHGTAVDNGDGTVTYTPDQDFHGGGSFTYTASDGNGGTDVGTVTVSVSAVNDAPVATDDSYSTAHDVEPDVPADGVLANDDDVDGDGLNAMAGDDPAHGTLTRHADGHFEYVPNPGFVGDDTFTYVASDGVLSSAPATVTISVTDQAPSSQNDAYPTLSGDFLEDTTLQVDAPGVLGNDSDLEGDSMSPAVDAGPAHGDVTLDTDGSFDYTPDPNFEGRDSFTYRSTDAVGGLGAPATVTIDVTGTEDEPTAANDAATTQEDHEVTIDLLANDSDPDLSDVLTVELSSGAASGGAVVNNGDGTVTYTPPQDFNGADELEYTVNDGHGGTSSASVSVTVTALNDPPVGVADDYEVVTKPFGSPASVLANDHDADDDPLHAVLVSGPTLGTFLGGLHADGTFTYSPNSNVCERNDSFTYRVVDSHSAQSAPVIVTLDVSLGKTEAVMTLTRSATTIDYHGSVTITAKLTPFSKGAKITITRTPVGDAPIPLITHAPDAQGNLKFVVPALLKRNAFTATSKFDNCHTTASSVPKAVLVRALITSKMANFFTIKDGYRLYHEPDPDDPNTAPKIIGAITPLKTGTATIEWQRKTGGKFVAYGLFDNWPIQGGKVTALLTSGAVVDNAYRIRITWAGDHANVGGPSPWVYFRVVP
jgi:VCBS repeat-containing protein